MDFLGVTNPAALLKTNTALSGSPSEGVSALCTAPSTEIRYNTGQSFSHMQHRVLRALLLESALSTALMTKSDCSLL